MDLAQGLRFKDISCIMIVGIKDKPGRHRQTLLKKEPKIEAAPGKNGRLQRMSIYVNCQHVCCQHVCFAKNAGHALEGSGARGTTAGNGWLTG